MKRIKEPICKTIAVALVLVAMITGCRPKNSSVTVQNAENATTPEKAVSDPRIPPAQRAALEQTLSQQRATMNKVGEQLKANASQHH